MNKKIIFLLILTLLVVDIAYGQCSMCKKMATDATEENDLTIGQQLNSGILYLLAVPYIILFVLFRKKLRSFWDEFKNAGR
ncbi:MAG TPA: hypothetical protein VD905_14470 [Flavobacteriales bacterium]|nr:hypothetical protein [Flavobacteriales bacterium]